ncbi:MAG TPA: phosphatidylglycerophosphatase A [Verrucomicrobiota bacterium]|nr:phosphatidylglycerophosphatase A [Verrucomicrobiota bacterium]HNU51039.1 phosphatidylglycerophosphatase A [Verrucomicrobiota bacterium]
MTSRDRLTLFLAQGLGSGLLPKAPGTFGSVVGCLWTLALLATGRPAVYAAGVLAGVALSVWCCGRAETLLGEKDPGSVVLDEIVAVPLAFAGWAGVVWFDAAGHWPAAGEWLTGSRGLLWLAGFAAFRLMDIWKPWPIRQSQALPGGWGITVDDLLAALAANLIWIPGHVAGWL